MEFESRSMDLGGQIHRAVAFFLLAADRWWHAVLQGWRRGSCISPNKVRFRGLKLESAGQTLLRAVISLATMVLPWWETEVVMVRSSAASLNKVWLHSFSDCNSSLYLPTLARGGSREFDGRLFSLRWWLKAICGGKLHSTASQVPPFSSTCSGCFGRRRRMVGFLHEADLPRSRDTKICYTHSVAIDCQPTMKANWWPLSSDRNPDASSTSSRRPCLELAMALSVNLEPSGEVPGAEDDGHGQSSVYHIHGGGPDCFPVLLLGVYFVKVRDSLVIFMLSCVPTVNCNRRFEI
jgi:hypothetical protein